MTRSDERVGSGPEYLLVAAAVLVLPRGRRDRWRREWYSTLDELHAERLPTLWFAVTALPSMVSIRRATRERRFRRMLFLIEDYFEGTVVGFPSGPLVLLSFPFVPACGALLLVGAVFDWPTLTDLAHWMGLFPVAFLIIANELGRSHRRAVVASCRE